MKFRPRPYQAQAVAAVIAGHAEHQSVIGRGATGLGKAAILAMLAQHYAQAGRVMVLVDVVRLVHQLADTFEWVTGERPGIEMGESRAYNGGLGFGDKIIISTFQTQYSGENGSERYRRFKADEFSCLLVDECETVFPTDTASRSAVDWYMTNPNIKVFGCTATPFRSDGIAAANLFGHVAFDYDILWGMENGWLVPARQAMVRVSVDFSTLKLRDAGDGERDYSPEEIASKIGDESTLIEIAKGILAVAEDRKSIVACPNVATARAVSHYLQGERNGCAQCIFGELGDEVKADIFTAFDRNEFQFLTSVMMLCVDEQTEILTESGWRGIDQMQETDRVANWKDGRVWFSCPKNVIRRPRLRDEFMVCSGSRTCNFRVTGNHMMLAGSRGAKKFKKIRASEIVGRIVQMPVSGLAAPSLVLPVQDAELTSKQFRRRVSASAYTLKKNGFLGDAHAEARQRLGERLSLRYASPQELTLDECRFIGFWVGDGTVSRLQSGGVSYSACQSVVYPKIIKWFDSVIERMGIDHRRCVRPGKDKVNEAVIWGFARGTGFGPQSRRGLYRLEPYLKKDGSSLWWGLRDDQFEALVEGYWMADGSHGDGTRNPRRAMVFTDTKLPMLTLLQAIGSTRGFNCVLTPRRMPSNKKWLPQYTLTMKKAAVSGQTSVIAEREWKQERVWCVETDSGNIITRRGGRVLVMGNSKGFDQPDIRAVFNCRKTKSKRLYQQLLGRGTRPLKGLLDDLGDATPEARRAAIAASAKPNMLMCNLVGVNEEVRDVTVTDILGSRHEDDVVERAKELQADDEDLEAEAALELAAEQLELEREAQTIADEMAQQEADAADDRYEADLRRRADVQAHVEVEYQDDLGAVATVDRAEARIEGPTPKQQQLLAKQVYPEDLARLSPPEQRELARRIVIRMQQGLCSYKQAKILQRNGYTREQTLSMRRDQAKQILDRIFAARGQR